MAWYNVECEKCGEEFRVQLYGKIKDREWKIDNYTWICEDCKAKMAEEAAKVAKESGLPELKGSAKQIAWAEQIRQGILNQKINQYRAAFQKELDPENEEVKKALDAVRNKEWAPWWINHRSYSINDLIEIIL